MPRPTVLEPASGSFQVPLSVLAAKTTAPPTLQNALAARVYIRHLNAASMPRVRKVAMVE